MNTGERTINTEEFLSAQFCALQYCRPEIGGPSALDRIIVLLIRYGSGAVRVFSRRDWPAIVQPNDHDYIRNLLADFKERALSSPDGLFRQASSLSVGPLVTYLVGPHSDLESRAGLLEACENMADLF